MLGESLADVELKALVEFGFHGGEGVCSNAELILSRVDELSVSEVGGEFFFKELRSSLEIGNKGTEAND